MLPKVTPGDRVGDGGRLGRRRDDFMSWDEHRRTETKVGIVSRQVGGGHKEKRQ